VLELALTRSLTAALCGIVVLPASALAADGEDTPLKLDTGGAGKAVADHAGGGGGAIVRTIVGLAVVIAVIYGVTWVLKQVKGARAGGATGDADLEPLSSLPLGPNASLHLVRAGNEVVLLGAGEHGLVPVRTYTLEEAERTGLLRAPEPEVPGGLLTAPARRKSWLDELRSKTVIR
jgi:flagellar protein FliO/FliZ